MNPRGTRGAGCSARSPAPRPPRWRPIPPSNYRYTTDPAIKAAMIARGDVAEGYVAMCSPL